MAMPEVELALVRRGEPVYAQRRRPLPGMMPAAAMKPSRLAVPVTSRARI
ncbi:MAG: hypothetical protein WAS21_30660 [Geminicoccaceae bacterium]|jgi:hypothetical protein